MVASSLSLSSHLFHHLLRPPQPLPTPPPPSSFFSLFLKPLLISTTTTITKAKTKTTLSQCSLRTTQFTKSLPPLSCHSLSSFSTLTHSPLSSSQQQEDEDDEEEEEEEKGFDDDEFEEDDSEAENGIENLEMGGTDGEDSQKGVGEKSSSLALKRNGDSELKLLPTLTVKEKKELASYAHSLGKKLKSQLVGKSGVTVNVASSFIETLEANELLKIKIHNTCPGELDDAVKQLEEATGSVVVGQIGRTVIIYRPSITKMKAEEKKRQARKVFVRKDPKLKHALLNKAQQRLSGRGRRGSSRFKLESDI
ncbi:DNA ligase 1-like [Fagus crenata]